MIGDWVQRHQDIDSRLLTLRIEKIETSKDLSQCKVYIYHRDNPETLANKLNTYTHPIHQYIFKHLRIRRVPKIKFRFTPQYSDEQSLARLLDEIDSKSA